MNRAGRQREFEARTLGEPKIELPPLTHIVDDEGTLCGQTPAPGERVFARAELGTARFPPERQCGPCLDVLWSRRPRHYLRPACSSE